LKLKNNINNLTEECTLLKSNLIEIIENNKKKEKITNELDVQTPKKQGKSSKLAD